MFGNDALWNRIHMKRDHQIDVHEPNIFIQINDCATTIQILKNDERRRDKFK